MRDLLALDAARPPEVGVVHPELLQISSPLTDWLQQWHVALAQHPDWAFAQYVLTGIEHGFHVGFNYSTGLLPSRQALPFSLWSAPKVFTAVPDTLQWVMGYRGVLAINHYLDDYHGSGRLRRMQGESVPDNCHLRRIRCPTSSRQTGGPV